METKSMLYLVSEFAAKGEIFGESETFEAGFFILPLGATPRGG
jgi:hypothetical protein